MTKRGVPFSRQPPRSCGEPWCDELRNNRLANGITQNTLAEVCGVEQHTMAGWERGVNVKAMRKWRRWANALGYDIRLVRREGND